MSGQESVQDKHLTPDTDETQESRYIPNGGRETTETVAVTRLAESLQKRLQELHQLNTRTLNSPTLLNKILETVSRDFREVIPYQRVGFSFLENNGKTVRAYWNKSDHRIKHLKKGYSVSLKKSSLKTLLETGQPRIIHDLLDYLKQKPNSRSTQLMLKEGFRSSLTCPLIAHGVPIGFVFFSSTEPNIYTHQHIDTLVQTAPQLAVIVDKARLITHLAEQKAAAEQKNDELRDLNKRKNTLLGIAAHDLRSPLSNVQMAANMLADVELQLSAEEQRVIINELVNQSNYMMDLLNDLLDVSHIESGKFSVTPQRIEIMPFLENVQQRHAQASQSKDVHLKLKRTPKRSAAVSADPLRLQQVFDNLISNAVKFSPLGGQIYLRAVSKGACWRFEVQDEGPGISKPDQKQLFQDFARLPIRPVNGERSTGLGLAIARRVIEAHKGSIGVDSVPGKGATFWFTLPI
jgi:signal transduction histidine kinase